MQMVAAHRNHPHHRRSAPEHDHNDYAGRGGERNGGIPRRISINHHGGTVPSHHLDSNKKKNKAGGGGGILAMVKRSLGGGGSRSRSVPASTPQTSFSSCQQQQQQCNNQNMMAQQQQQQQHHQHQQRVAHIGNYQYHDIFMESGVLVGDDLDHNGGGGRSGAARCDAPISYHHDECQQQQRRRKMSSNQKLMQEQQPPPHWGGYNRRTDNAVTTGTTTSTPNTSTTGATSGTALPQNILGATNIDSAAQAGVQNGRRNIYPTKSYSSRLFEQQQQQQQQQQHHDQFFVRTRTTSSSHHHHHHHSNFIQTKLMNFNDVWNSCDGVLVQELQQPQTSSRFNNVPNPNRAPGGRKKITQLLLGGNEEQQQQQQHHHPQANMPTRKGPPLRNCGMVEGGGHVSGALPSRSSMGPLKSFSNHQPHRHLPPNNINERGGEKVPTTTMTTEVTYYGSLAAARAHANQRRASTGQQYQKGGGGGRGLIPPKDGVGGLRRNTVLSSPSVSLPTKMNFQVVSTQPKSVLNGTCQDTPLKPHHSDGGEIRTIVCADVQGWIFFREVCSSDSMQKAVDIYDSIIRQCYAETGGYEIKAEGGVFHIAFPHPADALIFALQAQVKFYEANWPDDITMHDDGKKDPSLKFHGFRVKFGLHHGPVLRRVHETTGRTIYLGETVEIASAVEKMCHGGQILTTVETWNTVCAHGMAERCLGRPQVVDCGEHLLFKIKNNHLQPGGESNNHGSTITKCTRRIMQLVPSELAFDYFEARGRRDVPPSTVGGQIGYEVKNSLLVNGRLFPPLKSKRQLTTCFLNAPYANGRVTICFVHTVGLDEDDGNPANQATNLEILAKHIRKQLLMIEPPGYECREDDGCWMLAFDTMAHAVTFGLALKSIILQGDAVPNSLMGNGNRNAVFKIGIVSGPFTSMGPNKTTGKADYFGPIVNRAMQVASNCIPGEVVVGIPLSDGTLADSPHFGPTINVKLQGIKKLVGIEMDVAMFACSNSLP